MKGFQRLLQEFLRNPSSAMLRMDSNRDNVSVSGKDDVSSNRVFLLVAFCVDINPEGFWIKPIKVDEGGPIIRRFGKGLTFNVEEPIHIGEREGPNHRSFFVPEMTEAMPNVNL